jgi:hypothetical protein
MDHWLDDVARAVARGESRRRALRRIGGGLLGATLAVVLGKEASAQASCPPLRTRCGAVCVNLNNDKNNCGQCGRVCSATDQTCKGGQCQCPPLRQTVCNGACVNTNNDKNNCGQCGRVCSASGQTCQGGSCNCPPLRQTVCNNACVDTNNDTSNCGRCGRVCTANETCRGGACMPRGGATSGAVRAPSFKNSLGDSESF